MIIYHNTKLALKCQIIILFFKIHFDNKKKLKFEILALNMGNLFGRLLRL